MRRQPPPRKETKPDDWEPIYARFVWPESPVDELIALVRHHEKPRTSGSWSVSCNPSDAGGMPLSFQNHAIECLDKVGYEYDPDKWKFWVGLTRPKTQGRLPGFSHNFPHNHQWDGLTLVHCVQSPESGGDLVILRDDETEIDRFEPVVGTTSVIDGWTTHGVATVYGEVDRLTVIATGYKLYG